MRDNFIELLVQTVLLIAYGIGTIVVGAAGLLIEYQSYLRVLAGEYPLAAWLAVVGGVSLFFAYLIFSDKFLVALGQQYTESTDQPNGG